MPAPTLPDRLETDPAVFWRRDILRYADLDPNGHLNNTAFAVLFESGRVALIDAELRPTLPPDAFFVIVKLTIEFNAELFFPGEVRSATWVERVGTSSFVTRQAILSAEGPAAAAETVGVMLDRTTRRPMPLPEATRAALAARILGGSS